MNQATATLVGLLNRPKTAKWFDKPMVVMNKRTGEIMVVEYCSVVKNHVWGVFDKKRIEKDDPSNPNRYTNPWLTREEFDKKFEVIGEWK